MDKIAEFIFAFVNRLSELFVKLLAGSLKTLNISGVSKFIEKNIVDKLSGYGLAKHHVLLFLFIAEILIFALIDFGYFIHTLKTLFVIVTPFVLPFYLLYKIYDEWMHYARIKFLNSQKPVLLEIILPTEPKYSPEIMESFLSSIHLNPGEGTFIDVYLKGSTRPFWSFELVSIEGKIKMYIWTWEKFKSLIESQFKAHFPDVSLLEVQDYMKGLKFDDKKIAVWGTDYKLTKKDLYPMPTYVDWGLVQISPGSERLDPLNSVFEKFAMIGEGEVAIMHIMFQASRNSNWQKEVEKEIEKIYKEKKDKGEPLLPNEQELIESLKRSISKDAFDVGIRGLYIARKEKFNPGQRVGPMLVHAFRAFERPDMNYLIGIAHWLAGYDYPWQDPKGKEQDKKRKQIIEAAKMRSYHHPPYKFDPLVLTSEELASIFHFPTSKSVHKSFSRKEYKDGSVPSNLPS